MQWQHQIEKQNCNAGNRRKENDEEDQWHQEKGWLNIENKTRQWREIYQKTSSPERDARIRRTL